MDKKTLLAAALTAAIAPTAGASTTHAQPEQIKPVDQTSNIDLRDMPNASQTDLKSTQAVLQNILDEIHSQSRSWLQASFSSAA